MLIRHATTHFNIEHQKIVSYKGNYALFKLSLKQKLKEEEKTYDTYEKKLKEFRKKNSRNAIDDYIKKNEVNKPEYVIVRSPLKRSENKNIIAEQIEGAHYKLLYNGSKLFWRTQRTVDFDIYHHILPHAIEVIAFDSEKHKEINRLYLDYEILSENVAERVKESVEVKLYYCN